MEPTLSKKTVKIIGLAVFFVLILAYSFFGSKDLILGVKIKNVNLTDGITMTENPIKITGNARNAIKLILNGREISIDQQGNFEETIAFLSGYNIISIEAQDKFGYTDEKNYKIIH
jgi:hypothetical protein